MSKYKRPFSVNYRKPVVIDSSDPRYQNLERYRSRLGRKVIVKDLPAIIKAKFLSICSFNNYIPNDSGDIGLPGGINRTGEDVYPLENTNGVYVVDNGFLKYTINGIGSGALGWEGVENNFNSKYLGIMYDPDGNGNYGVDNDEYSDFLSPGSAHEAFSIYDANTGSNIVWGSNIRNDLIYDQGPGTIWEIVPNEHYVYRYGNSSSGWVVVQYKTPPGSSLICIHMLYYNSSSSEQDIYIYRSIDPDQDRDMPGGSYRTDNFYGLGNISENNAIVAYGPISNKTISLFTKDKTEHKIFVDAYWPYPSWNNPSLSDIYNTEEGKVPGQSSADHALTIIWKCGIVPPGSFVTASCAYGFGTGMEATEIKEVYSCCY